MTLSKIKSKKMRLATVFAGFFLGLMIGLFAQVSAQIPQSVNYQGILTGSNGEAVPDGQYRVQFSIYHSPVGGSPLWTELWDSAIGTTSVQIKNGRFNVMLGTHTPIPLDFFETHTQSYLGIKVGTDQEMQPRQPIGSAPYSFTAPTSGGGGDILPAGAMIMWYGSANAVPGGWVLCNGGAVPDMQGRFPVGVGSGYSVGDIGGSANSDLTHSHSIAAGALTTSAAGNHDHVVDFVVGCDPNNPPGNDCTDGADDGDKKVGSDSHRHRIYGRTQSSGNHIHTISGGVTESSTLSGDNRPPFYAVHFICKI